MSSVSRLRREEGESGEIRWVAEDNLFALRNKSGVQLGVTFGNHTFSSPSMTPAQAQQAGDALRAASVNAGGHSCSGKSLLEIAWDELMEVVDRILSEEENKDGRDPGRAEGMARIIAIFLNPYRPNVDGVRDEATDRWYKENGEDDA